MTTTNEPDQTQAGSAPDGEPPGDRRVRSLLAALPLLVVVLAQFGFVGALVRLAPLIVCGHLLPLATTGAVRGRLGR